MKKWIWIILVLALVIWMLYTINLQRKKIKELEKVAVYASDVAVLDVVDSGQDMSGDEIDMDNAVNG